MKQIDVMRPGENLGWCKPYVSKDGLYYLAINEGDVVGCQTPDENIADVTAEDLKSFARAVNPDYDDYRGWSDLHIALEAMREIGCDECPFQDDCDAVQQEHMFGQIRTALKSIPVGTTICFDAVGDVVIASPYDKIHGWYEVLDLVYETDEDGCVIDYEKVDNGKVMTPSDLIGGYIQ